MKKDRIVWILLALSIALHFVKPLRASKVFIPSGQGYYLCYAVKDENGEYSGWHILEGKRLIFGPLGSVTYVED